MKSLGAVSLTGTGNVLQELVISENEDLKNTINTLAAQGKDYIIIAAKGHGGGTSSNNVYFPSYFEERPEGVEASLSATGTFE